MTVTNFAPKGDKWCAYVTEATATFNVDIERNEAGYIKVSQKAHSASRYKSRQTIPFSDRAIDANFNVIIDTEDAVMDYEIESETEPTSLIVQ